MESLTGLKSSDICHWGQECDRTVDFKVYYGTGTQEWVGGCSVCAPKAQEEGCRTEPYQTLQILTNMAPETKDVPEKTETSCGCDDPDIWSRTSYTGTEFTRGSAYCKNCSVGWTARTQKPDGELDWVRTDRAPKEKEKEEDSLTMTEIRILHHAAQDKFVLQTVAQSGCRVQATLDSSGFPDLDAARRKIRGDYPGYPRRIRTEEPVFETVNFYRDGEPHALEYRVIEVYTRPED